METQGFYKKENNTIVFGQTITTPNCILILEDKDNYEYPIDGWIWAASLDDAISKFSTESVQPPSFYVEPEGFYLGTSLVDEAEFTKLVTLLKLSIDQGTQTLQSTIAIKDADKFAHITTVQRFFEIMVEYGLYCYINRNIS